MKDIGKSTQLRILESVRIRLADRIQAVKATLNNPKLISDDTVHAVRKHLKASRAGLRLLRGTIGKRRYSIENARLRDSARPLSDVRDSKVLLETAVDLLKKEKNRPRRELLRDLMRLLRQEREKVRSEMLSSSPTIESGGLILAESQRAVSRWSLDKQRGALASDIERIYRKSRKAMRLARDELTDDALHEARKQVKYLAYALEMLQFCGARHTAQSIKFAKIIGDQLGADRDFALIQSKVMMLPEARLSSRKVLCADIQEQRTKCQCEALRKGKRLHQVKARVFVKRLALPRCAA